MSTRDLTVEAMRRLLDVASALAETIEVKEICDTIAQQGVEVMGAAGGGVMLASPNEGALRTVSVVGFSDAEELRGRMYPCDGSTPAAEAVRTGNPVWVASGAEWIASFGTLSTPERIAQYEARAALPLIARGRALGALTFAFAERRDFNDADRAFGLALAAQCAQALDRALLYESERDAHAFAEAQRRRLESIFEAAPARIAVARGEDHVFEFANSEYVRQLDQKEIVGRPARDVFPGAEVQGIIGQADRVYATGETLTAREALYLVDHDGDGVAEERYFNVAMLPVADPDGSISGVMLFSVDVTDHVLARRQVERLAARLEAVLSQAADGIIITDADGTIEFTNQWGRTLLGMTGVGVTVSDHSDVFHIFTPDGLPFATEDLPVARALAHGETVLATPVLIRRAGMPDLILDVAAGPVVSESGETLGAVATFRDVTAHRVLQRQRDEFLAAVSHDLRTPLTTIKGLAQLARRRVGRIETADVTNVAESIERIDSTADKMNELIGRLLDLMRMQANEPLMLSPSSFDLIDLLREAVAAAQVTTSSHTIRLVVEETRLIGTWDGQRLERIIANLLSNAVKYSPNGGEIIVAAARQTCNGRLCAVVTVRDNGIGIPAEALGHVFDRFYRAPNVGTTIPGAGLGLAGVREVVEQHGGGISLQSELGVGTVVEVTLPLDDGSAP
jgi:signal transduction histidine kinase